MLLKTLDQVKKSFIMNTIAYENFSLSIQVTIPAHQFIHLATMKSQTHTSLLLLRNLKTIHTHQKPFSDDLFALWLIITICPGFKSFTSIRVRALGLICFNLQKVLESSSLKKYTNRLRALCALAASA